MITCMKHNIHFVDNECPRCKELRLGITMSYNSNNPEHRSKFIMNNVRELNKLTEKLKEINNKLEKLLKETK